MLVGTIFSGLARCKVLIPQKPSASAAYRINYTSRSCVKELAGTLNVEIVNVWCGRVAISKKNPRVLANSGKLVSKSTVPHHTGSAEFSAAAALWSLLCRFLKRPIQIAVLNRREPDHRSNLQKHQNGCAERPLGALTSWSGRSGRTR